MKTVSIFSLIALCFSMGHVFAQIPAFSGAQGPGANATGGRGGDVYHVTTLDADKNGAVDGSLQYGINNAPANGRTIVFDVGGTIYLEGLTANDRLRYGKANITIAGQTAPGPGITIAGTGTKWTGDNIILRNITIRPNTNANGTTHDAFDLQLKNSIMDHVTATWYTDEGISSTDAGEMTTIQYAQINEGLNSAGHSYGSIIATEVDDTHLSYNHNLYAHNASRMPRIGSEVSSQHPLTIGANLDFTNNVIYNWSNSKAGYSGTDQPSNTNFINNYYIRGNNAGSTIFSGGDASTPLFTTNIYQSGNKYDSDRDTVRDGVTVGSSAFAGSWKSHSKFAIDGVAEPDSADVALQRVLDYSGANWQNRNPIDERIVNSVRNQTGSVINDLSGATQAAEWNTILAQRTAVSRPAGFDTDGDGMPDEWEVAHDLDPGMDDHNGDFDSDGYLNLEEYLNDIAAWPAPRAITFSAGTNNRYAQITNWDIQWQPSRFDTAVINQGTVTVDAVGQHAGNLLLATNPGDNATLDITAGWIKVEDAPHGLSDGITMIGDNPTAVAEVNLSGGRLSTKALLKGAGGTFNFTGGTLSAEIVGFDLENNGGTIAPGESPGNTHVMGDLTINSGSLQIELGGTGAGEFDQLTIDGMATLGGSLDVLLLDDFQPSLGQFFQFVTASGGIFYEFDSVQLPTLTGGNALRLVYGETIVGLEVVAGLAGDFDNDGDVDGSDFLFWQRTPSVGNLADWQANYGIGSLAASLAVPEPGSFTLFLLLCAGIALNPVRP
ncbi:hypothetical protein [Bythopirellula polymerisocia]|uniref:Probable pectate lyase C n=1 Tax=Bythopirellula polymerisocia TaxID=2528003 RepID=A0A5C6CVP4_9BACT|nr:hypothetical protein [Bythopirellula polymerisocia]TWU27744.1 hypothetical protein Pla144_25210 [Bythopirellula polymerisocia]